MSFAVLGMGTAIPEHSITQQQAALSAAKFAYADAMQEQYLQRLYRLTGVEQRRSVLLGAGPNDSPTIDFYEDAKNADDTGPAVAERMRRYEIEAPRLSEQAAREALNAACAQPAEITHIVVVTCSGFMSPGVDVHLMDTLGLKPTVQRTQVGFMGCHGAINGMRVAKGYVDADPAAVVLLVAVELCSLHFQYGWDPERNVANALFADGAAAMVVGGAPDRAGVWRGTHTGSCVLPDSRDAMSWRIRNHGFVMTLSDEVPQLIRTHLRPWLEGWLEQRNLSVDTVSHWAVHPGGPAILRAVQQTLGIGRAELAISWDILRKFGNMSSPTVLFILQEMISRAAEGPCVALGFGPGLVAEAFLFE
ncbi:MAG: type III polyketide synthase [Candidatus Hydrogenedens sp.]|nr:type III polyketide synthase [Candidatus Hydrogenedens sp.]